MSTRPPAHKPLETAAGRSEPRENLTTSRLMNEMAVALGGRVAEEMVLGQPASGAAADLAHAREMARRMVVDWGMSETLGPLSFRERADRSAPGGRRGYSEEGARLIDEEIRKFVMEARDTARSILESSRSSLERVAQALLERETLTGEQFVRLVDATPLPNQRSAGARVESAARAAE